MSIAGLSEETLERLREPAFVVLLLVGMGVFAFSAAFLVIGVAINTAPPAPFVTPTDKRLLIGLSAAGMVVGVLVIRLSGRTVGW